MHFDEARSVRAELSMPIEFNGQYFTDFGTRIFFLDEDDGSEIIKGKDDDDGFGVVNIEINRK